MNTTTYIFGNLGTGYAQYPQDYTQNIFKNVNKKQSSPAQLVIHRSNNLMYYTYTRHLERNEYIGFCFLLNSVMISDLNGLFELFENTITHLSVSGEILKINNLGEIVAHAASLVSHKRILLQIISSLENDLNKLEPSLQKLPTQSYSISKEEEKRFAISSDTQEDILSAYYTFVYRFITKEEDSHALTGYKRWIKRLNQEKKELQEDNDKLMANIIRLEKEKKQKNKVIFLSIVASICILGLFIFAGKINKTSHSLIETQETLSKVESDLSSEQSQHENTKNRLSKLRQDQADERSTFLTHMATKDREIEELQQELSDALANNAKLRASLNGAISDRDYYYNLLAAQNQRKHESSTSSTYKSNNNQSSSSHKRSGNRQTITGTVKFNNIDLRVDRDPLARPIITLHKGWKVDVFYLNHKDGYYRVKYGNAEGYLHEVTLDLSR